MEKEDYIDIRLKLNDKRIFLAQDNHQLYQGDQLVEMTQRLVDVVVSKIVPMTREELKKLPRGTRGWFYIDEFDNAVQNVLTPEDPKVVSVRQVLASKGITYDDELIDELIKATK